MVVAIYLFLPNGPFHATNHSILASEPRPQTSPTYLPDGAGKLMFWGTTQDNERGNMGSVHGLLQSSCFAIRVLVGTSWIHLSARRLWLY